MAEEDSDVAVAASTGHDPVLYGLADQNGARSFETIINSSAFQALRVRRVRYTVPWDMMARSSSLAVDATNADSIATFEDWYEAIVDYNAEHDTDLIPMVTFDRHRGSVTSKNRSLAYPSYDRYRDSVGEFMETYPGVRELSAFNEPNDSGHQLADDPEMAATLYRALRSECDEVCGRIVSPEFVGNQNYSQSYLEDFIDELETQDVPLPKRFAWHAYKAFSQSGLAQFVGFLQRTGNRDVWLTEQGGVLRHSGQSVNSETDANTKLKRLLELGRRANTNRIKRFYVYQWRGNLQYDAGLISRTDPQTTRSLYTTFKHYSNPLNKPPLDP